MGNLRTTVSVGTLIASFATPQVAEILSFVERGFGLTKLQIFVEPSFSEPHLEKRTGASTRLCLMERRAPHTFTMT
jgi:hypothetical protein